MPLSIRISTLNGNLNSTLENYRAAFLINADVLHEDTPQFFLAFGLSIKHISVMERGIKNSRISTIQHFSETLGVTPNSLLLEDSLDNDVEPKEFFRLNLILFWNIIPISENRTESGACNEKAILSCACFSPGGGVTLHFS